MLSCRFVGVVWWWFSFLVLVVFDVVVCWCVDCVVIVYYAGLIVLVSLHCRWYFACFGYLLLIVLC